MLQWLREKLKPARSEDSEEDYPSVVILLEKPQFQSKEQVLQRAQTAWGTQEPVELKWIIRNGRSYMLRCGPLSFAIHQSDARYGAQLNGLTELELRSWNEHTAWTAIDLPKLRTTKLREDGSLGMFYKILTIYAFLFWSPNCLAVYFPAEGGVTAPSLGELAHSINWARQNGQNLDFLNTPKNEPK